MARTIVVCCDGTWNKPDDRTNVWRAFAELCALTGAECVEPKPGIAVEAEGRGADGSPMLLYYDTGVGTERRNRLRGGATAHGLAENVKEAYDFLCRTWQPGDAIYCLGFSRGAFTVRSLGGLVGAAGLVEPTAVDDAFGYYRIAPEKRNGMPGSVARARERRHPSIRFMGVYDTVGSLGVVADKLRFLNRFVAHKVRFHDTQLGAKVEIACQALAIDERRGAFKPVMWSRAPGRAVRADGSAVDQQVLQVWFAGSHGDVGGGYRSSDLSDIAHCWMLSRALDAGLPVDRTRLLASCRPNPFGPRHDSSRTLLGRVTSGEVPLAGLFQGQVPVVGSVMAIVAAVARLFSVPPHERQIGDEHLDDDGAWSIAVGEMIHHSVTERFRYGMPERIRAARAAGVPIYSEAPTPATPLRAA